MQSWVEMLLSRGGKEILIKEFMQSTTCYILCPIFAYTVNYANSSLLSCLVFGGPNIVMQGLFTGSHGRNCATYRLWVGSDFDL